MHEGLPAPPAPAFTIAYRWQLLHRFSSDLVHVCSGPGNVF